jgi:drug/metabolite transporter (DMT)-like permease
LVSIGANRRGIFSLIGCMAAYAVSDVATKLVARTHPFGEVIAIRGVFTILLVGFVLVALRNLRHMRGAITPLVLIRSVLEALSSGMYVAALIHMPIANAAALVMIQPLILVALSAWFYAEVVGWRRWTAVLVGFAGVLFIVKPTPVAFDGWAFFGLGAAFFGALREMATRRLDPAMPTMVVVFMSTVALTAMGFGAGVAEDWRVMATREVAYLALAACFFSLAVYLAVRAFREVDISVVAPFRYTFLVWAGIAGYAFFNELPDVWSIAGAALIVGSGLYTLHREALRRRAIVPSA